MLREHTVMTSNVPENGSAMLCAVDTSPQQREKQALFNVIRCVKAAQHLARQECHLIIGVSCKSTACLHTSTEKSTLHQSKCKLG